MLNHFRLVWATPRLMADFLLWWSFLPAWILSPRGLAVWRFIPFSIWKEWNQRIVDKVHSQRKRLVENVLSIVFHWVSVGPLFHV